MFNIGFTELIVILLVALLIVGPKDLPKVARALARGIKKIRSVVDDLKKEAHWDEIMNEFTDTKKEVDQAVRENDVTQEFRALKKDLDETLKQADVKGDLKGAKSDLDKALNVAEKAAREVLGKGKK